MSTSGAAPTLTLVSPSSGSAAGGTSVTITGTHFTGVTGVKFGTNAASNVTVHNPTQIIATTPAGTGQVDVTVTTGNGTSATSASSKFTYVAVPTLSGVSPSPGPTGGGTSVTLTGTHLTGATSVQFGGTAASYTVNSATQISATSPAHAAGAVNVVVTTPGGTATLTNGYTYTLPPTALAVSATVAANSSANPITPNITGAATSVALSSAASHGTATASGTSLSYTPAVGYSGSDSFTYTATNASGTSAPATVTVTVNKPMLIPLPSTLSGGIVGTAYSATLGAVNGTAPYSYAITAGSLPAGLSLNTSSGTVSGTSSTSGTSNFTVTATDAYGATGSRAYSVVMAAPLTAPGAPTAVSATAGNAQASVAFSAPASDGGAAITGYTVTSSPGNITATGASSPITVTGLTNGQAYTFTVTATNAAGTGAASAASNSITPLAPIAHAITATAQPSAGGSATCSASTVGEGGSATCTATAHTGYGFQKWTGACAGQAAACSLTSVTAPQVSAALFVQETTGLVVPEGPQQGQGLALVLQPSAGNWVIQSASTATVASTGTSAPSGVHLLHGLVNLRLVTGTAGTSATVVLTYPQALPAGTRYYKFGKTAANPTSHWYEFSGALISGNTITLTLTDGGAGDNDLTANSVIEDPGGPALLAAPPGPGSAQAIPTLGEWGLALLSLLAAALGAVALRRRGGLQG